MSQKTLLFAKGIKKKYGDLEVLKGIDLDIQHSEIVSIVGASGAGKSTLLHILGTLDKPNAGEVVINDKRVDHLTGNKLAAFRNSEIGFVFQFHNLLPEFTAWENALIPAMIQKKTQIQRATELFKLLAIDHRQSHKPSQLSGGEQQRVAVVRALINSPSLVLADEPSGNLDSKNAQELHELFFQLRNETGQTFAIVTHNQEFADMADRKIELSDGKVLNVEKKGALPHGQTDA
jgi:lipoprotein-releasing system ATP-binding protein